MLAHERSSYVCLVHADLKEAVLSKHAQRKKQSTSAEALREGHEEGRASGVTFLSLRRRLQRLLVHAVESETDPRGMQFLISGMCTMLQDAVSFENEMKKKQRRASVLRRASEPCTNTRVVRSEDIEILVSDDFPKEEGQREVERAIPKVIVTRGSATHDETEGESLFIGEKAASDTGPLLEKDFSESGCLDTVQCMLLFLC